MRGISMSIWYWLYDVIIGSLECLIIGKEILGLEWRKGWGKYVKFLILFVIGIYCFSNGMEQSFFSTIWFMAVVCIFFQNQMLKRFLDSFLVYLIIILSDTLVWGISLLFSSDKVKRTGDVYDMACGIGNFTLWCFICIWLHKKEAGIQSFFKKMTWSQKFFGTIGLFVLELSLACMQGFLFDEMTVRMKKYTIVFFIVAIIYIIFVYGILIQTYHKKRYLEEVTQISNQYLELQKEYYIKSIEKYEELKSYRHDIRSHMQIIQSLCEQKRSEEAAKYAGRLNDDYKKTIAGYTGNVIADCLLAEMLDGLRNRELAEFEVLGKLPSDLPMEDVDSCILFSNAFQNASEALQKQKQNLRFYLTVKQGRQEIHITIQNSVTEDKKIDLSVTDKPEREEHGYGVKNMKRVVDK